MKKHIRLFVITVLALVLGIAGLARAEIIPPRGEGQIGLSATILCENLSVRQDPSTNSKVLVKLHYGNLIIVMQQENGWARISTSDSENDAVIGWVNADYIMVDPAMYCTDKATPVYAWDDLYAPKVALLDSGTTLTILKQEGDWICVSLRGAAGWICLE